MKKKTTKSREIEEKLDKLAYGLSMMGEIILNLLSRLQNLENKHGRHHKKNNGKSKRKTKETT